MILGERRQSQAQGVGMISIVLHLLQPRPAYMACMCVRMCDVCVCRVRKCYAAHTHTRTHIHISSHARPAGKAHSYLLFVVIGV